MKHVRTRVHVALAGLAAVAALLGGCGEQPGTRERPAISSDGGGAIDSADANGAAADTGPLPPCGCLLGEGPYCAGRAREAAKAEGCTLALLAEHPKDLLKCEGDTWSLLEACPGTCNYDADSTKLDDACELPVCECFVKVAWCGSGVGKKAITMGCRVPLLPEHRGDILHCPEGKWAVKQACKDGCIEAPEGTPDACKTKSEYLAPFACGATYSCTNGNHTSTHTGKDAYAYDFGMPVGTTLHAMRAGSVLRVRMVSLPGSSCYNGSTSQTCANYANTVEVKHSDGTVGLYMHLSKSLVSQGQQVAQGDAIAKSGNSGWSYGPHLHLQVQQDCGIWWCQSIPFTLGEQAPISRGVSVTSANCP